MKKTHSEATAARVLCGILALTAAAALICGCDGKSGDSSAAGTTAGVISEEGAPSFSASATATMNTLLRSKTAVSDELLADIVKLFDGKTVEAGEKLDLSVLKVSDSDKDGFERIIKTLTAGDRDCRDEQTNILTFTKKIEFSITYDDEKITVNVSCYS